MKKLTLIIFVLIFFQITASSQNCFPCLQNGITFSTQSQIDSFQINFPGCTEIVGNVEIGYSLWSDITNLDGLNVLTSIGGDLSISGNEALNSLTGLDNVTSIGGDLKIHFNDSLTSLTGLNKLPTIGGSLSIVDNENLTSLMGFDNLTSIGGHLEIAYNEGLTSLMGLENLTSTGTTLVIESNDALTSLTGLDNVTSIGKDLVIVTNTALTSITGLDNVTSIGDWLVIYENTALTSLTGLDNIDPNSIDSLFIGFNSSLSTCAVQSICDYLAAPGGVIEIHDNATGCNSQQEVQEACDTLSVPDIYFNDGLSIFPNPFHTRTKLLIENFSLDQTIDFYLYDFLGREVFKTVITSSPYILVRPDLPNGIYIWKAVGSAGIAAGKLVFE